MLATDLLGHVYEQNLRHVVRHLAQWPAGPVPVSAPTRCSTRIKRAASWAPAAAHASCAASRITFFIVFHALEREEGNRKMCVQRLCFESDGTPMLSSRPNCGKRLRLGAEQEDDLQHFGNQPPQNSALGGSGGKMSKLLNKVKDKLDS